MRCGSIVRSTSVHRTGAGSSPPIAMRAAVQMPSVTGDDRRDTQDGVARRRMAELHVSHPVARRLHRYLDRCQDLGRLDRRRHHALEEPADRYRALAVRAGHVNAWRRARPEPSAGRRRDRHARCCRRWCRRSAPASRRSCAAASASIGHADFNSADDASSACVVRAPIRSETPLFEIPFRSAMRPMSTRAVGVASRSFMSGIRLCPPASSLAPACSRRSWCASPIEPAR